MKKKNLLDLTSSEAKSFFLTHEAFSNIDLPQYISFSKLLSSIDRLFPTKELTEDQIKNIKKVEHVNHVLYGNKDGKYAWRKFEIMHPLIYVSLVNIITDSSNWKILKDRFKSFKSQKNIECESIPVLPRKNERQKASQIIQWVNNIERKSISLSLEYKFIYQTDISDCYGSIYTHSLPWAIHTKGVAKGERRFDKLFGNKIDQHLQAMSHGQTNGIPQGSILTDFLAEIVLGYADEQLDLRLKETMRGKKYHILRYRDDYRIFVDDISDGDVILKSLSETLLGLGFRLNVSKTFFSQNIIGGSIKPDKSDSLKFDPVPRKLSKQELIRHLLIVQQIGMHFPNSGTLLNRLSKIIDGVEEKMFKGNERMLASLLVDIAYNNPICFPLIASLVSTCVDNLAYSEKKQLLTKIQTKICSLSNIGLIEIWMQRMSIGIKLKLKLSEKLCSLVYGKNVSIFETSWIADTKIKEAIKSNSFIDKSRLSKIKWKISRKEVQVFEYNS